MVSRLKPPTHDNLENAILENLNHYDSISSNELYESLHVNKKRYTDIKNHMIEQGFIKEEIKGNRTYLNRMDFEDIKFQKSDYTMTAKINCKNYLTNLKKMKPIATSHKNNYTLKKNAKIILDALFIQLDTIHTICTRLEYARTFGLMNGTRAIYHKNKCLKLFDNITELLFSEHKKFKNEIINHYQSQVRTLRFKV